MLVGVGQEDTEADCDELASKVVKMRLWPDENGQWKKSVRDIEGEVLCGKSARVTYIIAVED